MIAAADADVLGLCLGDAFFDRLWCAFDEILCLFEAKTRDFANDLDDVDLLLARCGELNVELGLFCCCRTSGTARPSASMPAWRR